MNIEQTIVIYTKPTPKGRPRAALFKNGRLIRVRMRTPEKTRDFEDTVRQVAQKEWSGPAWTGPVELSAWFVFGKLTEFKRSDLDNLLKAVKDALNGVAWVDDKQVVRYAHVEKRVSDKDMIRLTVRKAEG